MTTRRTYVQFSVAFLALVFLSIVGFHALFSSRVTPRFSFHSITSPPMTRGRPQQTEWGDFIHFAYTTATTYVGEREGCAIESAARKHPTRPIMLHTPSADIFTSNNVSWLEGMPPNVFIVPFNLQQMTESTPLSKWYGLSKWQLSQYQNVHVSDAWRLAVLYKFGGTYLDNDIVTLRPTTCLKNFISIQSDDGIPNHAFSTFDRGYTWLKELMGRFTREYNHQQWDYNGPQLLNRDIVGKRSIGNLPRDLTIGPKEAFYRIHWNDAPKLFKPSEELARGLAEKEQIWNDLHSEETYGVHLWNAASKSMRINQRSVLASVFQLHCPTTFAKMQRLYNWV